MKKLTEKQSAVFEFLKSHFLQRGYWPSIREIQSHFKFKSTNAVIGHLKALESKGYICRIEGQARAFRITDIEGLAKSANASALEQSSPYAASLNSQNVVSIPIMGNIAAGYPDGIESGEAVGQLQLDYKSAGIRRPERAFALKVRGESMIDAGIFEGDVVVLEQQEAKHDDIVAALIDNECTLKRFIKKAHSPAYLKAENSLFPDLRPVSELLIQGVAKAVVRSL